MPPEPGAADSADREALSKIGRYEVVVELGRGGMGVVVKARNPDLNKMVAIKVLNSSLLIDGTSLERFKIEAMAGGQFSHPNLVSIFDIGVTTDGSPYMVMEYISGQSLQDKLSAEKKLDIDFFLKVFEQVAKGLQYIHKQNIVHRDIKASNIMLQSIDGDLYAKLVDFGIAKVLTDGEADPQKLTKTGSVFGSPPYMSPEQCQGKIVDARSDIYSLGCVMYECLSGVPPIMGDNALQTIFGHVSTVPETLAEMTSGDPTASAIAKMIHKCLEKDPALRFQTSAELISEISNIKGKLDAKQFQTQAAGKDGHHAAPVNRWKTNVASGDSSEFEKVVIKRTAGIIRADTVPSISPEQQKQNESAAKEKVAAELEKFQSERLTAPPVANADDLRNITQLQLNLKQQSVSGLRNEGAVSAPSSKVYPLLLGIPLIVIVVLIGAYSTGLFKGLTPVDHFQNAKKDFALGKTHWEAARQEFLTALDSATNKNDAITTGQIRLYLGRISLGKSDGRALTNFTAALKELEGSKEQNRDDYLSALTGLAEAQIQDSDFKAAEKSIKDAKALADKWKPSSEVRGDLAFLEAKLRAKDEKNLHTAANLYDRALLEYEKSSTASAERKTTVWLESAKLHTELQQKPWALRQAQNAITAAAGIKDEAVRTELIREASDLLAANKPAPGTQASAEPAPLLPGLSLPGTAIPQGAALPQVPQVVPVTQGFSMPQPSAGAVTQADVDLAKGQADLKQQQLEQLNRTRKYVEELGRAQDENFRRTTENLKRYSNSP
ncbi:MAG: protein kinase [Candidatus Melainabacteria bacterium]|nr:protein kinase [Candidatus Melainabacteria bacterium]